ncbi:hypothetical protein [Rosistilla oblonga]|nr:hypothetical protein [Rosistilla oblonga]
MRRLGEGVPRWESMLRWGPAAMRPGSIIEAHRLVSGGRALL